MCPVSVQIVRCVPRFLDDLDTSDVFGRYQSGTTPLRHHRSSCRSQLAKSSSWVHEDAVSAVSPTPAAPNTDPDATSPFWRQTIARHERASLPRSLLDLATSVVPYLALSVAMYSASTSRSGSPSPSRSRPPASCCAPSSSSTTAPTARSCPRKRGNLWLGRLHRPARLPAVRQLAPQPRRPSRHRRRSRPPRHRRRPDADRR